MELGWNSRECSEGELGWNSGGLWWGNGGLHRKKLYKLHNKTNYTTKPITRQNQLHNRIKCKLYKLKTNPTTTQFNTNSESIQHQLIIKSMLLPSLSTQFKLNSITQNSIKFNQLHTFNQTQSNSIKRVIPTQYQIPDLCRCMRGLY